jgi:hypothetical protein
MPERRRAARVAAALAGGLLATVVVAPVALAQTDELPPTDELDPGQQQPEQQPPGSWEASSYEEPFDADGAIVPRETFDIEGTLRYQKRPTDPSDFIQEVEVRVVDDPGDSFTPGEGCSLPSPTTISGDGLSLIHI